MGRPDLAPLPLGESLHEGEGLYPKACEAPHSHASLCRSERTLRQLPFRLHPLNTYALAPVIARP